MKILLPDAPAPAQLDALSPLEEGQRGPDAAQAREKTLAQLKELEQRARSSLAVGASRERYAELAALLDASLAAQEVLDGWAIR